MLKDKNIKYFWHRFSCSEQIHQNDLICFFVYLDNSQISTISVVAIATVHLVLQRLLFPSFLSTRNLKVVEEEVNKFQKGQGNS